MRKILKISKISLFTYSFFGFLFWHFAKEMLQVRSGGWYVGQVNLYGDLVYHLSLINKFLNTNNILIDSPIFAGDKVNYPIFADLTTSLIARITGVDFALFLTTFIGGLVVIFVMKAFIKTFVKNEKVSLLTFLLFFFNGGFGFYYFFKDYAISQKGPVDFLLSMPREYTDLKDLGYWWINSFLAYFIPQRAFLFAFPVTLVVLLLLYRGYKSTKISNFILAGFLAGSLAIIQTHSLFLLFILCLMYIPMSLIFSKDRNKTLFNWIIFTVITILVAYPLFKLVSTVNNPIQYLRFAPGWTSKENIIWFWFKNLGLFAPLLIISIIWLKNNKKLLLLYLPFLALFIVSNIFIFQPWEFDNSKLLIYWYFASSIIVANLLNDIFFQENKYKVIIGVALVFIMMFSSILDIFRTFTPITSYQIYSKSDLMVDDEVQLLTPKNSVFVTATNHNNPIPTLTGRSTILGFPGWLWSHGINYSQREKDVSTIYLGEKEAESLIKKYKVNYLTVGPEERKQFSINISYFNKYPQINLEKGWVLYDVSNIWTNSIR
jgi:hypothetical protein